ncbi:polysaccharide biosynthesis/export family protein, partial [bacterium AH-315-I07]|nr:polysaccharide biosynthesis/export family protein [bacterium AH-315-I07]
MQKLLFRTTFFFFLASSFIVLLLFLPPDTLAENYIIGSGDVLQIDVYDHDDLKKTVRVSNN